MSQGKPLVRGESSVAQTIRWSQDLYARLKAHAEARGIPIAESVRDIVSERLEGKKGKR